MNGGTLNMNAGQWTGVDSSGVGFALGFSAGATGNYIQTAGTAVFSKANVDVGYEGTGNFQVKGGTATVNTSLFVGTLADSNGLLEVTGGVLEVGGAKGIRKGAGSAQFNLGGGELRVIGSALTNSVATTLLAGTTSTVNTNGLNATFSGGLDGSGNLIKTGAGKLTVTDATATGAFTIAQGTAEFANNSLGFQSVSVQSGAILSGTGSLALAAGSSLTLEIGGAADFAKVSVGGSFNANGSTLNIVFVNGYFPSDGASFDLLDFTSFGGSFAQVNVTGGGVVVDTSLLESDGIVGFASAIPEPGSFALLAGAFAVAAAGTRRRARRD